MEQTQYIYIIYTRGGFALALALAPDAEIYNYHATLHTTDWPGGAAKQRINNNTRYRV